MTTPEQGERPRGPAEIAGVALARPRASYTLGDGSGRATLKRGDTGRLSHGTLELELGAGVVGPAERRASFALDRWLHEGTGPSHAPEVAGSEHWRALVVEHGLLGRPELVRSESARKAFEASPAIPAGVRAALATLALRFASLRQRSGRAYDVLECAGCRDARIRSRAEEEQAARSRRDWGYLPTGPTKDCAHAPFAVTALDRLCVAHPELTFETIGWLVPEAERRHRGDGPAPSRFVLDEDVHEAILGHWLLAEAPEARGHYRYGYGFSYHRGPRWRAARRSFRLERGRPTGAASRLPDGLRAALAFAAEGWGITMAADDLLAPADAPSALPALGDVGAPALVPVTRVLPEAETSAPGARGTTRKTTARVRRR